MHIYVIHIYIYIHISINLYLSKYWYGTEVTCFAFHESFQLYFGGIVCPRKVGRN